MQCPYCASSIPQAAIVCPHCTRDFYLFKPLLERIEQLEARLQQAPAGMATHEARLGVLESELAALKAAQPATSDIAAPLAAAAPTSTAPSGAGTPNPAASAKSYWMSLLLTLSPALALLVAAHIVLLFIYDVRPLFLRIASIAIPIPFGFALLVWHPQRFRASAIAGFAMAAAAVWLMLVTTAYADNVAVMPQKARDLREVFEYIASIGLAFLTGLLLGKLRYRRLSVAPEPNRFTMLLAELFSTNKDGNLGVVLLATRIQKMVSAFTPIGAGAASIYAGIKALIGDGG